MGVLRLKDPTQGGNEERTTISQSKQPLEVKTLDPGAEKPPSHGDTQRKKEKTLGPGSWPVRTTSAETLGNGQTKKTRSNMRSDEPRKKPKPNSLAFNTAERWKDLMGSISDQRTDIGTPLCQASKNDSCQAKKPKKLYISYMLKNIRGISKTSS
jgi:hypothetical protein